MMTPIGFKLPRWAWWAIGTAGGSVVLLAATYGLERTVLASRQSGSSVQLAAPSPFVPVDGPGLTRPPTRLADAAGLRDDEPIIGVAVAGQFRAYQVSALSTRTTHLVNDVIADRPVTVAYCDIDRCTRVYHHPGGTEPLKFRVGGLYVVDGAQMVLNLDGSYYFQRSGQPLRPQPGPESIPYPQLEPTETTWGDWHRQHPATDVFTGESPVEPALTQ